MQVEQVFSISGSIAMTGWLILILAPRRWVWFNAVPRYILPFILSMIYAGYILAYFDLSGGGYGSFAEVKQLFTLDELLLAGWVHYLAFDLMIGGYLADRMDRLSVSRIIQAPILVMTFMFGPVGVLLAFGMEAMMRIRPNQNAGGHA